MKKDKGVLGTGSPPEPAVQKHPEAAALPLLFQIEQMQLDDMDEIETQLADLEEEQSREEEPAGPELDLSDPNKQMGQDDIAALLASMGVGVHTCQQRLYIVLSHLLIGIA